MLSSISKPAILGIALGFFSLSAQNVWAANNNGDIPPAPPIAIYGIVTDVTIPAGGVASITWQELTCDTVLGEHVANGDPVTCTTLNSNFIQAATTASMQEGAGQGWVGLTVTRGACTAIMPTKKYSERYLCEVVPE